jgi:hypothetical protein
VTDFWDTDCAAVEPQKAWAARTLSFKERWVLMVARNLGRSAVPSSALDALVCWIRWAAMQRENLGLMKSGEGDG